MLDYTFFLNLAIILGITKVFSMLSVRIKLPQVVGAIIAGIIIGPTCLSIVSDSSFLEKLAEIGVILLMFTAGLETDVKELKKTGLLAFFIALCGIVVPLGMGYLFSGIYTGTLVDFTRSELLKNIFLGIILTATSVAITVEALREMGRLNTRVGTIIISAAIIDDVLGIILLSILTSFKDESVVISQVLIRIVLFFVFAAVAGAIIYYVFKKLTKNGSKQRRIPIFGFVLALLMAYIAEHFFGVADITGAFVAGIIMSSLSIAPYVTRRAEIMSYMIFSPIFFASIGLKIVITNISWQVLLFSFALIVIAIISKIIGCGLAAKVSGINMRHSLRIGIGMITRGEVCLIMLARGKEMGLVDDYLFTPIILIVIITSLISPLLLKLTIKKENRGQFPKIKTSTAPDGVG